MPIGLAASYFVRLGSTEVQFSPDVEKPLSDLAAQKRTWAQRGIARCARWLFRGSEANPSNAQQALSPLAASGRLKTLRYCTLMAILDELDWAGVRQHYDERVNVSKSLKTLLTDHSVLQFANLALGIIDVDGNDSPTGNYSAAEHNLGPKILYPQHNPNAEQRVFELAEKFSTLKDARTVPDLIAEAQLSYLKIGVGSEISCMVNPQVCWVANTRTIWTHLVIKHNDNVRTADDHLKLYRESDVTSEMDYQMWAAIHAELRVALTRIAEDGQVKARRKNVTPGRITYIWADAIASAFYGQYHD